MPSRNELGFIRYRQKTLDCYLCGNYGYCCREYPYNEINRQQPILLYQYYQQL